ncbi:exonuclease subunit SbcD [Oceanobacter mangrovi]|uniref:exonuclease subunit SbcD n=1 Tax=Oceanobacter mangrovi TaxID=2862510 RepID=UPI001C8D88EF|nr:exonuclease subunit SbcD [Oceanobacter mangrovi]
MNLLHTSDWHLGQNFFTQSRKAEHQQFLDWLLVQVQTHAIDAVIVAGDVFDTGTPPSYAREMYNRFIVALNQLNCTLVVLGGNHDSVSTLNESRELLACLNTYVVAGVGVESLDDQVLEIRNAAGEVAAIVCAIPFVRPRDVLHTAAGESGDQKRIALGEAIQQHYDKLYQLAQAKRDALLADTGRTLPIIATGHLTALGVKQSESVRDIYIGTLDGFDAHGFPPADYIALGHIHRPQIVAKNECIRYSGSPIPLSFDELKSPKQVVKVAFAEDASAAATQTPTPTVRVDITPIQVPVFQPMAVLKGDLQAIETQLKACADNQHITWLCVEVQSQEFLADLPQRVQALTDGLPVEVLQLRRARNSSRAALVRQQQETLAELTPADVFEQRLAQVAFEGEQEQARLQRIRLQFRQLVEELEHESGSDAAAEEGRA